MSFSMLQKRLDKLQNFDLERISTSDDFDSITLRFSYGEAPDSETELSLKKVSFFRISRSLVTNRWYYVGEVTAEKIDLGTTGIFEKLGYGFVNNNGTPISVSDSDIFHCHIEGDIVIDVLCQSIIISSQGHTLSL